MEGKQSVPRSSSGETKALAERGGFLVVARGWHADQGSRSASCGGSGGGGGGFEEGKSGGSSGGSHYFVSEKCPKERESE